MMLDRNDLVKFSRKVSMESRGSKNPRSYLIKQDCQNFVVSDGRGNEVFQGRAGRVWQWLQKEMEMVKLECV